MLYILLPLIFFTNFAMADFFKDISKIISNNIDRLSYGVAVTDINLDNKFEFIVAGFKYPNLALSYQNGILKNIIDNDIFKDVNRSTIGVAACDTDQDGKEELYFLNTDTYSGTKKYSDRLLKVRPNIKTYSNFPKSKKFKFNCRTFCCLCGSKRYRQVWNICCKLWWSNSIL